MAKGPTITMWRRTIIILLVLLVAGFGIVVCSLVRLQLIQGKELKQAAVDQQLQDTKITAQRGTIYDANGKILAQSASVWRVILEPKYLLPMDSDTEEEAQNRAAAKELVVSRLSEILGKTREEIEAVIAKGTYYEILERQVETDTRNQIVALQEELAEQYNQSSGIILETDYKRYYPNGTMAASVLGFVGTDGQGLSGLEQYYDDYLSGTAGRSVSVKNAVGTDMPFEYDQMVEAQDGYSLQLTIDSTIQNILEKYLNQGIVDNNVHNGAVAICMNVKTGAILGLANANDYDPNDPYTITDSEVLETISKLTDETEKLQAESDALQKQWRNKAVSDTYYPGSVFKMVTVSSALEEGLVTESDTFNCVGYTVVDGQTIHCHLTSGHGVEDVTHGTMNSCNPCFMWLGFKLGQEKFSEYFAGFGFTEKTGIDLPGEATAIYKSGDEMSDVDLAVYSFGQNFSITPIQMITACAAIANGGYVVQPYVVSQVMDSDGNIVKTTETNVKRQVISEDVSKRVSAILYQNAIEGTAKNGYVAGYRICGKTGTSEKVDKYNEEGGAAAGATMQYIASYCGYAPVEDPEIALLVFYDEPDASGNYYGGSVCGPVFANMMSEILPYLGVEAQYSDDEEVEEYTTAPNVIGQSLQDAEATITNAGLTYTVYGSGSTVLSQSPQPNVSLSTSGNIALFTDTASMSEGVTVPNLVGKSYAEVNSEVTAAGLQLKVTGVSGDQSGATSSTQSIAAGTKVQAGTIITVNFITRDAVQ